MLNQILLPIIENIESKSLIPLIADRVNGAISERGLRNKPSADTVKKVGVATIQNTRESLLRSGMTEDEVNNLIRHRPASLYAGLIFDNQTQNSKYPLTIKLAEKVDVLSSRLFCAHEHKDDKAIKEMLLSESFLIKRYWDRWDDESANSIERSLSDLATPHDVNQSIQAINLNCALSLMALWDIEFCSQYFKNYQSRSIFDFVLPKIDPVVSIESNAGQIHKKRSMLWFPYRRLLDFMYCLGHFVKDNKWPLTPPTVKQLINACDAAESDIVKWRRGTKRIDYRQFATLWKRMATIKGETAEIPSPIYTAATFWHTLFTQQSSDGRSLILLSDRYLDWWNWHKNEKEASDGPTGVTPWPQCFTQI